MKNLTMLFTKLSKVFFPIKHNFALVVVVYLINIDKELLNTYEKSQCNLALTLSNFFITIFGYTHYLTKSQIKLIP